MPFDGKPEQFETPADVFSIRSLIAWLERERWRENEEYCYLSCGGCLLAQYFIASGYTKVCVGGSNFDATTPNGVVYKDHMLPSAFQEVSRPHPRTMGAALDRARAYVAEHPE